MSFKKKLVLVLLLITILIFGIYQKLKNDKEFNMIFGLLKDGKVTINEIIIYTINEDIEKDDVSEEEKEDWKSVTNALRFEDEYRECLEDKSESLCKKKFIYNLERE